MSKDDYEVGYGKPPQKHQFKKGRSGNPKGRPKGKPNRFYGDLTLFRSIILSCADQKISVNEAGTLKEISIFEASMKALTVKAAKGDIHAIRTLAKLIEDASQKAAEEQNALVSLALKYRQRWLQTCAVQFRSDDPLSLPMPHPDHVKISFEKGDVLIDGPVDREQLKTFLICLDVKAKSRATLLCHELNGIADTEEANMIERAHGELEAAIPDADPLWRMFGEDRVKEYLDWHLYYGEKPVDWKLAPRVSSLKPSSRTSSWEERSGVREQLRKSEDFRKFMRAKLYDVWHTGWDERFTRSNLQSRDIEHDLMRYEFETSSFDPDRYEMSEEERTLFRDPDFLNEFMVWD